MDINPPHRYPFRFLDASRQIEKMDNRCRTLKQITGREWFIKTGKVPPAILAEFMAQAAGLLLDEGDSVFLAGMDNVRFHRDVYAGDSLEIDVSLKARMAGLVMVSGRIEEHPTGRPVAEGTIVLAAGGAVNEDRK